MMLSKLKKIEYSEIKAILDKYDQKSFYEKVNYIPDSQDLYNKLEKCVAPHEFCQRAVLGIDIYKYSSYQHLEQTLIPFVFKILFDHTIKYCIEFNQFVFQKYSEPEIQKAFLSTGDGGFLILDTPLHALLFAINFELVLRAYNSYHLYPKLRKIIGYISLRYAITYDTIYTFNNNYYGRSIINNARILDRDNLNRCLIEEKTHEWFLLNIDGIENLQVITIEEVSNIFDFQEYDKKFLKNGKNAIINTKASRHSGIINSDLLKIGEISLKETSMNVYNLHIQVTMTISDHKNTQKKRKITISLGNLNTSGI